MSVLGKEPLFNRYFRANIYQFQKKNNNNDDTKRQHAKETINRNFSCDFILLMIV